MKALFVFPILFHIMGLKNIFEGKISVDFVRIKFNFKLYMFTFGPPKMFFGQI